MMQGTTTKVHAVVVTYRRPDALVASVEALARQTFQVASLVVVDNDGELDPALPALQAAPFEVRVLHAPENLGPAGGFAFGIDALDAERDDWVLLLDDDDPLRADDVLEQLLRRRDALVATGVHLGGVGMNGSRYDARRARTAPMPFKGRGLLEVDHLHGCDAPLFRIGAVEDAGNFRSELFWGFEELEFGLRINDAGWRMFMDGDLLHAAGWTDKLQAVYSRPKLLVEDEPFERRYYKFRNLNVIAKERSGSWMPQAILFARGVLKPLVSLPLRPRAAWAMLRWNLRARRDAGARRLGRTVGW